VNLDTALDSFPLLATERLILREIRPSDRYAIFRLFSDPLVTRYNDVETLNALSEAEEIIEWLADRFISRRGLRWGIALRHGESGSLIGTCGFNSFNERGRYASIGYDLMTAYWGQGIVPEAVAAMLDFGFGTLGLNRIEADVVVGNTASVRVLEKLGFGFEGVLRQRGYWKGAYHDLAFYALLASEYQAR
jgi:ribosomal-protein-alanine N-acetyltransferase